MKIILLITILSSLLIKISKSQIPVNDPSSWILQPDGNGGGTEEFNAPLNLSKWTIHDNVPSYWGAEYLFSSNLDLSNGTSLKIKADTLIPSIHVPNSKWANPQNAGVTYVYQGGAIETDHSGGVPAYKFGYIEIEAKYPTGVFPLWPAFWLWSADCSIPYINEIDIAENYGDASFIGTTMGTNIHLFNPAGNCYNYAITDNGQDVSNLPSLATWHKYAIQWAPDRVIWYFDDMPVRTVFDLSGNSIPQYGMAVVLNFAVDPWSGTYLPSDWNAINRCNTCIPTGFPKFFEINYLRYYKLDLNCNSNLTICNPTDYDRKVYKTIITNNLCTPNFNQNNSISSYTLRATDFITIDEGAQINPTNTGYFAIETMPCPQ